jgi:hypothetical protein
MLTLCVEGCLKDLMRGVEKMALCGSEIPSYPKGLGWGLCVEVELSFPR